MLTHFETTHPRFKSRMIGLMFGLTRPSLSVAPGTETRAHNVNQWYSDFFLISGLSLSPELRFRARKNSSSYLSRHRFLVVGSNNFVESNPKQFINSVHLLPLVYLPHLRLINAYIQRPTMCGNPTTPCPSYSLCLRAASRARTFH